MVVFLREEPHVDAVDPSPFILRDPHHLRWFKEVRPVAQLPFSR